MKYFEMIKKIFYFIFSSYVRETMEETGIARKLARDFPQQLKRSVSKTSVDPSPKMMTRATQHFSSNFLNLRFLFSFYYLLTIYSR
jgi:hypothetical protein